MEDLDLSPRDDDTLPSERKVQERLIEELGSQREIARVEALVKEGATRNWGVLARRVIAFIFDCATLVAIGKVLGFFFGSHLSSLGENGIWIGVLIAAVYFTILDSSLCSGASLGKRFFRIEVRHINGSFLNPFDAFLRFVPIAIVFSIAKFCTYADQHSPIILGLELVGAAIALAIVIYALLYPMNRTFADVMLNSVVVLNDSEIKLVGPRPKSLGTVLLVAIAAVTALQGFRAWQLTNDPTYRVEASVTELLRRTIPHVDQINVTIKKSEETGSRISGLRTIEINAMITREEDYKRATGIASHMKVAVESSTLLPTDVAYMDVALKEGYDIGITADIEDLTFKFPLLRHGGNVRMKLTPGKSKR